MAAISPHVNGDLKEVDEDWRDSQLGFLVERLAELELAQDDVGWLRLSGDGDNDFTRSGLRDIAQQARLYFLKHPLINRAVLVQSQYVFAQGLSVVAQDERVQDVLTAWMDDPKNQTELTSHQARVMKEQELAVTGNLFFAMFVNPSSGRVRVRSIPFAEVEDIYFNPDDRKEPWYYLRQWTEYKIAEGATTAQPIGEKRSAWYPDWRHTQKHPPTLGGVEVRDVPVYHVKVGGLPDMKFGVSEVYQAIDWARAYKEFLTDFATLVKALSRFAWKSTVKGGVAARTAATQSFSRQPASASEPQVNRTTPGSTFVSSEPGAATLDPIPKTGTTIPVEEGRRLLLMVAAATGLPETFFGDVSVGTLATATSLDRPTELKFADRQALWRDVHVDLLDYVIDRALEAPSGQLAGTFEKAEDGEEGEGRWVLEPPDEVPPGEEPPEEGDRSFQVSFPPILAHDIAANVAAAVSAVTLNGSPLAVELITPEQASRILLQALGVEEIDDWLAEVFPVDDEGNPVQRPDQIAKEEQALAKEEQALKMAQAMKPPPGGGGPPPQGVAEAQEALAEAIRELVGAVEASKLSRLGRMTSPAAEFALLWLHEALDALELDRDQKEEALAPIYDRVEIAFAEYWMRSATLLLQMLTPTAWKALNVIPLKEGPGWSAWMAAGGLAGSGMTHPEFVEDYNTKLAALEATNKLEAILVKEAEAAIEAGYEAVGKYSILQSFAVKHPNAAATAGFFAGEKIAGINATSQEYVKDVIRSGINNGVSYDQVAKNLIKLHSEWAVPSALGHIRSRAELIAVTEMGNAYVAGTVMASQELVNAGLVMEKHWLTVGDMRVDKAQCATNDAAGWIPWDDDFPSGHFAPLAHPGCRCDLQSRKVASQGPEKLKAKLEQEPSSISPTKPAPAPQAAPPAPKPPAPLADQSASAKSYAGALLAQNKEGPTAIAKKINAMFPDEKKWTPQNVGHFKQTLQKKGILPPSPKAGTRGPRAPKAPSQVVPKGKPGQPLKLGKTTSDFDIGKNVKALEHLNASQSARVDAKISIQNAISNRLKGNAAWETYSRRLIARRGGTIDADNVSELIGQWASTSADHDPVSLAMQLAAHREFGLSERARAAAFDHLSDHLKRDTLEKLAKNGDAYQAFLRAMYDHTQETFAREGITHVSLYRGQALTDQFTPDWARSHFRSVVEFDADGNVRRVNDSAEAIFHPEGRPLSSFSADSDTAWRFSSMLAEGTVRGRVVFRGTIPVENIIGGARTGYGCLTEYEFVILESPGEFLASITPY